MKKRALYIIAILIIVIILAIIFIPKNQPSSMVQTSPDSELNFGIAAGIGIIYYRDGWPIVNNLANTGTNIVRLNYIPLTQADSFLSELSQQEIQVLLKPGNPKPEIYPNPSDYYTHVYDVVSTYSQPPYDIIYYEIGNEPELTGFFSGTIEEFGEYMRQGHNAVKAACPNCYVLNGGMFDVADSSGSTTQQRAQQYRTLLMTSGPTGLADYFDILSVHIYHLDGSDWEQAFNDFRSITTKPMWVTESGLSSEDTSHGPGSPELQAREVIYRFVKMLEMGADTVFIYTIRDKPSSPVFSYFGLYDDPGNPKLAFYSYITSINKLSDFNSATKLSTDQYKFTFPAKDDVYVLWDTTGSASLPSEIQNHNGDIIVTDYQGTETTFTSPSQISLSEYPIFIELEGESCLEEEIPPCDGCVDLNEIVNYIGRWLNSDPEVTASEALSAIFNFISGSTRC